MPLTEYTDERRADIVDEHQLRAVLDELRDIIADIEARLTALENAKN